MRPVLLLAAFLSFACTLPAHADIFDEVDALSGSKQSCDAFDYSCQSKNNERKIFSDDRSKEDATKSAKPQKAEEPRGYFDPQKKSSSIGDSIREQLKPR